MKFRHINRKNARKDKHGSCCKLCKAWKAKWQHKFKFKDRMNISKESDKVTE